jgi:ABC-2 type transport system permease protein
MSQPAEFGAPQELGVIHDIGFRHYTGPRLGRGYLLRSLYIDGLKGAYGLGRSAKSKIFPFILLAITILPALIVVITVGVSNDTELPLQFTEYVPDISIVVAIFLASQSPASVSRDLRFRVMPLYFSRPLSRNDYVLAKYAALSSALFILMGLPLVVLYVGALLSKLSFWTNTKGVLGGLIGAALFALLLAAIGLLIASITPKRGFGVAAVITVIVVLTSVAGILQALAKDHDREKLAGYLGGINPFGLVDGVQVWLFGADSSYDVGPSGNVAGIVFLLLVIVEIAACYGLLLLRYRKVSAS